MQFGGGVDQQMMGMGMGGMNTMMGGGMNPMMGGGMNPMMGGGMNTMMGGGMNNMMGNGMNPMMGNGMNPMMGGGMNTMMGGGMNPMMGNGMNQMMGNGMNPMMPGVMNPVMAGVMNPMAGAGVQPQNMSLEDNQGWNLIFENQNDKSTITIRISEQKYVKEAISMYLLKSGRTDKCKFIFNNKELFPEMKICQSGLNNLSRILVISIQNVIGAK